VYGKFYYVAHSSKHLAEFLAGIKKGSKKFRVVIGKSKALKIPVRDPIISYARIAELPVPVDTVKS
jgi:hypothetical protein